MKKLNLLGALVIGLGLLAGCSLGNDKENDTSTPPNTGQDTNNSTSQSDTQDTDTEDTDSQTNEQNGNEAENMVKYSNDKWGFEVQYPDGYEPKIDVEKEKELDFSIRKTGDTQEAENKDGVCSNCTFKIQALLDFIGGTAEGSFSTPESWLENQKKLGVNVYAQTIIAGQTAYTLTEKETGRRNYLVFLKNKDNRYDRWEFSLKGSDKNAEKILSTFNFTKI